MQNTSPIGATTSVTVKVLDAPVVSATEQNQKPPSASGTVMEEPMNHESTDPTQEQELSSSPEPAAETTVDQKPRKYVLSTGGDLFQSLFAAEKTPPTSPGSVASSNTLMDPSSRKVSPSDSETRAKGSPTAVQDFAYPSPDNNHVRNQLEVVEETTRMELLKQLKKKTAAEEKASRKAAKLAARTKSLSADLKSANATVQNRDVQLDLAKTYANAMSLSNFALRQAVQDLSHELSREKSVIKSQETQSQGDTTWSQQKQEHLQNHLELVGGFSTNIYGPMADMENASAESGQPLDDVEDRGSTQQASNRDSTSQPEIKAEESEGQPKEKAGGFFEKYGFDPAALSRIVNTVIPTDQEDSEKEDTEESSGAEKALRKLKEHVMDSVAADPGLAPMEAHQDSSTEGGPKCVRPEEEQIASGSSYAEETEDQAEEAIADSATTNLEDKTSDQDSLGESSDKEQVLEADDDDSPPTIDDSSPGSGCDQGQAAREPIADSIPKHDDAQGMDSSRDSPISGNCEFSEAAGPAALWGILQSVQRDDGVEDEADADEEVAGVFEVADPPTPEGIHKSNQHDSEGFDQEATGANAATVSEVEAPGPATLWGILISEQKSSGDNSGNAFGQQAEANGAIALDKSESNNFAGAQDEDLVKLNGLPFDAYLPDFNNNAIKDTSTIGKDRTPDPRGSVNGDNTAVQEVEAPGPATLWGILESDQESSDNSSGDDAFGQQTDTNGTVVLDESERNAFAGAQDQNFNDDANDLYSVSDSDNEAETAEPPPTTDASTIKEDRNLDPNGSVNGDDTAVQEVEAPGPATLWGILKSDCEPSADNPRDEKFEEQAGANGDIIIDDSEGNASAEIQDQDDAKLNNFLHDHHTPDINDEANELYNVSDNEEEFAEPLAINNAPTVREASISSPHDSVGSDNIAVQDVNTQEVVEEVNVDTVGANTPDDAVEAAVGPTGGLKCVAEGDTESENGAVEAAHLHDIVEVFGKDTLIGAAEDLGEDATGFPKEESDEEHAASTANTSDGSEDTILALNDALPSAHPFPDTTADKKKGPEEYETLEGPAESSRLDVTYEEVQSDEDRRVHDVATESSRDITAEGDDANIGTVDADAQVLTSAGTLQAEEFDANPPTLKTNELTKGQRRNLERKRATAKKKEQAATKRRLEEEAAKTPEVLARRLAEEDSKLGERRLALQAARTQSWERMTTLASVLAAKGML